MELLAAARVSDARALPEHCARYLDRLPLDDPRRASIERDIADALETFDATSDASHIDASHVELSAAARDTARRTVAMAALHRSLAGAGHPSYGAEDVAYSSVHQRLELEYGAPDTPFGPVLAENLQHRQRLFTAPPLNRSSMIFAAWRRGDADARETGGPPRDLTTRGRVRWHRAGAIRRTTLLVLALAQTAVAVHFMTAVLPYHGTQPLEIAMLALFAILFFWISGGFWTAMAGFMLLARGDDRFAISRTASEETPIDEAARTAIIMPIANENVARVFAGLRATYQSLASTGELAHFDFYVLSDSSDPEIRLAEIDAWIDLCRAVDGFGRVFYRWRVHRIKRKSGNVADFCRRWGKNYRYMIVLDADSVMSGECVTQLVRISEANPASGIIQTAPRAAGRDTLYARMQQFATRLYGPLFTAGLHFWQLGESHYWGHNAIIRVEPFMRHCALARLPGRGNLSGEILSHDFVEAALMRRAGWAVWIAYDLPGSYEEMPPNFLDELKRDRRWCQGNLMNFRLFTMIGLHPAHRAVFMTGMMAYLSAPLWFAFLLLSTALLAVHTLATPEYFVEPYQLFPVWPEWHPEWAISLFSATALLLFLPKIVAAALRWGRDARRYGGRIVVTTGMVAELLFSAMLAPIRMLFHTEFVVTALMGFSVRWKSPPREDAETSWGEAVRRHGAHSLIGVVWASGVFWLNPSFLWWLLPVVGALMLSIPLSVLTSRVRTGRALRREGFFVIPEELAPPPEIRATRRYSRTARAFASFTDAAVDPVRNALACATGVARIDRGPKQRDAHALVARALEHAPDTLPTALKAALLSDPIALSRLHFDVWTSERAHPRWREATVARRNAAGASPLATR